MNITNKYAVCEETAEIAQRAVYRPQKDVFRVTELINPPMIRHLTLQHWDDLSVDVADLLWSIFGTDVHAKMEQIRKPNIVKEMHMEVPLDCDKILRGTVDLVDLLSRTISDYKTTSVFKVLKGEFADYEMQINFYNYLLHRLGFPPMKRGRNILFLKDWVASKAKYQDDYPKTQEVVIWYSLWPIDKTKHLLDGRIQAHLDKPKVCSPAERWEEPTTYAVMKRGRKSALPNGLKNDPQEAEAMANKVGGYVEIRDGRCRRCEDYCVVRKFCPFGRNLP